AAQGARVEPGLPRSRGSAAPGEAVLRPLRGVEGRRRLPLRLRRQAAPRPAAIGLGLVPAHVEDGAMRLQSQPAVEVAPLPAIARTTPVDRPLGADHGAPPPALFAPQLAAAVAAVLHESGELVLGHRR